MIHTLCILGSLDEFVALTKKANARKIRTVVCDDNTCGPAKAFADAAYDIPVTDIAGIADICRKEQVDAITTSFSDLLLECMVKIADVAGLPCYLNVRQLPYYRDKSVMKQMFNELQIGSAKSVVLERNFPDSVLDALTFPVVAKPLDKYGSRGLCVLYTPDEIRARFDEVCASSDRKEVLIEEYNDGHEFNMMTWVSDGIVHPLSIADREKTPIGDNEIPISTRNVYPSCHLDEVLTEATAILQKIAGYTIQREGALSMQFFWKKGTPIHVGEVAARYFGYEHELLEYCSGLSIEDILLDYAYDKAALYNRIASHDPHFKTCSAALYFQAKSGHIVADVSVAHDLAHLDYVRSSCVFYHNGETTQTFVKPYAARYYITAPDRVTLDARTDDFFHKMKIMDRSGMDLLYRNKREKRRT